MSSEHVEVLREMKGWRMPPIGGSAYNAALDAAIAALSAPQPPAEAHCATCSCVPGMTPAVRFDTTPAEKEGAVRDHLIRMGWTPPAEAQPRGRGCGDHDHASYIPGCGLCAATLPEKRMAAPPSAPVGVEGLVVKWKKESESLDIHPAGLAARRVCAIELEHALAQQPAAAGEEIMVNAAHDVYTLPLQPSGLSSGPRFVVHVPGAEQPAAVDDLTNAWRAAFVEERATRYREGGMKIEQARIHAETDAARIAALAAAAKGVGND